MLIIRAAEARRWLGSWAAAATLAMAACMAAEAAPQRPQSDAVIVSVDHAKVVRLPEKAQTVVVGNPAIADVSVQRNGVMIVTGKSFGVTNLIALDANGTLLAESLVRVGAASSDVLTVQRGMDRESYACNPECQPSVQMGDEAKYFAGTSGQVTARNALATPSLRN
jgi:Flp pilus assembly secretin CpaC